MLEAFGRRRPGRITGVGLAFAALLAPGCAVNPVSGKSEPVIMSEEKELELGREAAVQVQEQMGLVEDGKLSAYVDQVGQRLTQYSQRKSLTYSFRIIDVPEPNAFALPDGHIYVSRGMLSLLNSEDELATVLGHEMGHVAARHAVARSTAAVPLIPLQIAAGLGGMAASIVSPMLGSAIAATGQVPAALAIASYSRGQEREADRLGQEYAAAAGWDPAALSTCMHSLAQEQELAGTDPERANWFSSHPTSPERSRDTRDYARSLTVSDQPGIARTRDAFLQQLDGMLIGDSAGAGVFVDNRFLHPELNIGLTFPEGWELINTDSAVVAEKEGGEAAMVLSLAESGKDPTTLAREAAEELRFVSAAQRIRVNGFDAVVAVAEAGSRRKPVRAYLLWVAQGETVYRIIGVAELAEWDALLPVIETAGKSFRGLSSAERGEIREKRLRVVAPSANENLGSLVEGSQNQWSLEETAVMNGLSAEAVVGPGVSVKISRLEPHRP